MDFRRPDELWTHLGPFVQIYQLNPTNQDILENMLPDPERPDGATSQGSRSLQESRLIERSASGE